jgi:hypothetical protein
LRLLEIQIADQHVPFLPNEAARLATDPGSDLAGFRVAEWSTIQFDATAGRTGSATLGGVLFG